MRKLEWVAAGGASSDDGVATVANVVDIPVLWVNREEQSNGGDRVTGEAFQREIQGRRWRGTAGVGVGHGGV